MREILFRGKRVDNGEWIEGQLSYFFDKKDNPYIMPHCYFATREFNEEDEEGNEVISNEIAFGGYISVIPETVGQYSGREINGYKLFEDDFFKVGNTLKVVKFFNMAFCICNVYDLENEHTVKVLGNSIYQYPDENWWRMFKDELYIIGNIHD